MEQKLQILEKALDRANKEGLFNIRESALIVETLDSVKETCAKCEIQLKALEEENKNKELKVKK